jgi:hypothetical protein
MAVIKETTTNVGKDSERDGRKGSSYTAGGNVDKCIHCGTQFGGS